MFSEFRMNEWMNIFSFFCYFGSKHYAIADIPEESNWTWHTDYNIVYNPVGLHVQFDWLQADQKIITVFTMFSEFRVKIYDWMNEWMNEWSNNFSFFCYFGSKHYAIADIPEEVFFDLLYWTFVHIIACRILCDWSTVNSRLMSIMQAIIVAELNMNWILNWTQLFHPINIVPFTV